MSNGSQPVPLTLSSTFYDTENFLPSIAIGQDIPEFPGGKPDIFGGYWIVIVDRRSLDVVYNQYTEQYDTAPDIGSYDTTDYMIIVTTVGLGTGHVPQGGMYDFLVDSGAGKELKRIVQLNATFGCGSYGSVCYSLVGVLGPGAPEIPGIEVSVLVGQYVGFVQTLQLLPMDIGGTTYYYPSLLSD